MQFSPLPRTGEPLSVLGFGAMRFPTRLGIIQEKTAKHLLLSAIDGGVNYLDTGNQAGTKGWNMAHPKTWPLPKRPCPTPCPRQN